MHVFLVFLYNWFCLQAYAANSIKVVLSKREKVEYERECLCIFNRHLQQAFRARIQLTFSLCFGTTLIELAVYHGRTYFFSVIIMVGFKVFGHIFSSYMRFTCKITHYTIKKYCTCIEV